MLKKLLIKIRAWLYKRAVRKCKGYVHYINGSEQLPAPLSKEEEEAAFKLMATDYETARETLIVHNLRLVVYIAKKFENTGIWLEDLVSIGTLGLIKAVNTFSMQREA